MRLLPLIRARAEHFEAAEAAQTHQEPVDVDNVKRGLFLDSEDPKFESVTVNLRLF